MMEQNSLIKDICHSIRVIIPAAIMGIFFSLPSINGYIFSGVILLSYIVAVIVKRKFTMPSAWLHTLSVNAISAMSVAILILAHDMMKPFPDKYNINSIILLACGIMFLFMIFFGVATFFYWYLERSVYNTAELNIRR